MTQKALANTIYSHQMLTENGWQTVAAIVAEMQANGVRQICIDRWLQGLERGLRARRLAEAA